MADVKDEALAQLAMRLAQCEIDRAMLMARLASAKEIAAAVLEAIEWQQDEVGRRATIPADMVVSLQGVVTSL